MPKTIELSIANHPGIVQTLHPIIARFEQACNSSVHLTVMEWDTIWKELVNIGIYKRGADVSEVGTTWMGSLISMNALRAFSRIEIAQIGGERAFLPTTWQTTSLVEDARVMAIPFLSDVRVIFYWRDMLEKAGVAEDTAFSSFEEMEETLSRLKEVVSTPWALSTDKSTHDTLYSASSWVWASGGDFISPDGRKTLLTTPTVRSALKTFFGLHRFMPSDDQPINGDKVLDLFRQRKIAAIMGGPWVLSNLLGQAPLTGKLPQLGIALPPGPSFVGGMNLVIWQHTHYEQECIELIRYLVTPQMQIEYCPILGLMPASVDAVADPYYSASPHYKVMVEAIYKGRVPTGFPLWGMVEDKLSAGFFQIWADIFKRPDDSLDTILSRHLDALANRLDITLGNFTSP
jgi:multiple sugar transport system substrate-binding protein